MAPMIREDPPWSFLPVAWNHRHPRKIWGFSALLTGSDRLT